MQNTSFEQKASIQTLLSQISVLQQESLESTSEHSRKVLLELAIEKTTIISQTLEATQNNT